jgi:hypothetical protein
MADADLRLVGVRNAIAIDRVRQAQFRTFLKQPSCGAGLRLIVQPADRDVLGSRVRVRPLDPDFAWPVAAAAI